MDIQPAATPTRLTIPAPPLENTVKQSAPADWRDAPLQRRSQADRTHMAESDGAFFGEEGPKLTDVIDILNPLQHIPFVATLYRELTGDKISTAAKLAGGALFGGPLGLMASIADSIYEQENGAGMIETAMNTVLSKDGLAPTTQVAQVSLQSAASAARGISLGQRAGITEAQVLEIGPAVTDAVVLGSSGADVIDARAKLAASRYQSQADKLNFSQADILSPASAAASIRVPNTAGVFSQATRDNTVLDLFGASKTPSAAQSYYKANMLGYLQESSRPALNG